MNEVIDKMASAFVGAERYDALPERATYTERKSSDGEWRDRAELHADMARALRALRDGVTEEMVSAGAFYCIRGGQIGPADKRQARDVIIAAIDSILPKERADND